jgi:hypothetical protein
MLKAEALLLHSKVGTARPRTGDEANQAAPQDGEASPAPPKAGGRSEHRLKPVPLISE